MQVLPGGRLLVPEYYTSRCTERRSERRSSLGISQAHGQYGRRVQRLPNGNTLIATMSVVVEYTRSNEKVAEFANLGIIYQAIRHRNGHTYILANNSVIEFGNDNKQIRDPDRRPLRLGGFSILPNGNFLIAFYGQGNKYAEVNTDGKIVWEHAGIGAAHAHAALAGRPYVGRRGKRDVRRGIRS